MRIQQSNNFLPQNSLGARKARSEKDIFSVPVRNIANKESGIGASLISGSISSLNPQNLFHITVSDKKEEELCFEAMTKAQNAKISEMNGLLNRLGIRGEVTGVRSIGGTPGIDYLAFNKYTVTTEGSGRDLIIFDFGFGRIKFVEVEDNPNSYYERLQKALQFLHLSEGDVSEERLMAAMARFFGVDSLKCLFTQFGALINDNDGRLNAVLLQYEKFQDEVIEDIFSTVG